MQIHDPDKVEFFKDEFGLDSSKYGMKKGKLPKLTRDKVASDNNLSVQIIWKYPKWLFNHKDPKKRKKPWRE
jgi:hypothetical protein